MYCRYCGAQYGEHDAFCGACGAKIAVEAAAAPIAQETIPDEPKVAATTVPVEPIAPIEPAVPVEPVAPVESAVSVERINEQPESAEDAPVQAFAAPTLEIASDAEDAFVPCEMEELEQPLDKPRPMPTTQLPEQESAAVPAKKRGKKGAVIGICIACVLVLALLGGILSYIFIFIAPAYSIKSAVENTAEELNALLDGNENFLEFYRTYRGLTHSGEMSYRMEVQTESADSDGWSSLQEYRIQLHYSRPAKQLSGQLDFSDESEYDGERDSSEASFAFSADEEQLLLQTDLLDNELYSLPLKDFGKEFTGSYFSETVTNKDTLAFLEAASFCIFPDIYWDDFYAACPEAAALIDSLKIEKSKQPIANRTDLKVYAVQIDADLLIDAINAYIEFALVEVCGQDAAGELSLRRLRAKIADSGCDVVQFCLGIDGENRLAALCAYPDDEVEKAIGFSLEGEKNLWSEIRIFSEDTQYTLRIQDTGSGFLVSGGEDEYERLLECNDDTCELTVYKDGEKDSTVTFRTEGEQVVLITEKETHETFSSYSSDINTVTTIRYMPLQKFEMLSGNAVSIFSLSEEDLKDVLMELIK